MKIYKLLMLVALTGLIAGCADLDIPNENEPDSERVFASAEDMANIPGGAFVSWHQAVSTVNTGTAWACNADVLTCSWGNFGIRNMSWQPPLPIDNSLTSNDAAAIGVSYGLLYGANSTAIDVESFIIAQDGAPVLVNNEDISPMLESVAYFLQGVAHAHVSIMYNQGFIADANVDVSTLNGEGYAEHPDIRDFAVAKLEQAATIAAANDFTLPITYMNGLAMTSDDFAKLARTVAAYTLVLNPREPADVASVDWAKVLTLSQGGLDFDYAPIGDGSLWFDDFKLLGGGSLANGVIANTWARIDNKLINLMDPAYPTEYPTDGSMIGEATTSDQRISTDFLYRGTVYFPVDRGRYRFGEYVHNRYAVSGTDFTGIPIEKILKAENDLMQAEALVRTGGSKATAATLINNTRVTRGGLPALTGSESDQVFYDAIKYEKMIELLNTWGGRELAEARRWDGWLRDGAFTQLPVPGSELTLLGVPIYTFGGVQ